MRNLSYTRFIFSIFAYVIVYGILFYLINYTIIKDVLWLKLSMVLAYPLIALIYFMKREKNFEVTDSSVAFFFDDTLIKELYFDYINKAVIVEKEKNNKLIRILKLYTGLGNLNYSRINLSEIEDEKKFLKEFTDRSGIEIIYKKRKK